MNIYSTHHQERGFTLLETAVVLLISGIMLAASIQPLQVYLREAKQRQVTSDQQEIVTAIASYQGAFSRYPCPSDPELAPGDDGFGMELGWEDVDVNDGINDRGQACADALAGVAVGACVPGTEICKSYGGDVNGNGIEDPDEIVITGAIPIITNTVIPNRYDDTQFERYTFVDQGLSASHVSDPWKTKYTYAVTESQLQQLTFKDREGAVQVEDEFGNSLMQDSLFAHFVLLSHGDNGRGGFSINGNVVGGSDCDAAAGIVLPPPAPALPPALSGETIEKENCDQDGKFRLAVRNEKEGNSYNDDIVIFSSFSASNLWAISPGNQNSIYSVNPGNVGVGVPNPQQKLHVVTEMKADTVMSDNLCDKDVIASCFNPQFLGGPPIVDPLEGDANTCGKNQAVVLIQGKQVHCENVFADTVPFPQTCPSGQALVGFERNGTIICATY